MNIQDILQLGVVSVVVSLLIQFIKLKYATSPGFTKLLTVAFAIAVGALYVLFQATPIWNTILEILTVSSTVYALFLNGTSANDTAA